MDPRWPYIMWCTFLLYIFSFVYVLVGRKLTLYLTVEMKAVVIYEMIRRKKAV